MALSFLSRLFMPPEQRALKNPEDFDRPQDAAVLERDLKRAVRDPETRDLMISEVRSLSERGLPVTIGNAVADARSLKNELSRTHDRALHEFGIAAHLGADLLASHLILRVNKEA